MFKKLRVYLQALVPQHALSVGMGKLANSTRPWLKNWMIHTFIQRYQVNMQEALIEDPNAYASFNDFFIRRLKPTCRSIVSERDAIASPVDGVVSAVGHIENNQLLQVKNHYFNLENLLGNNQEIARLFLDGEFITLYLAPRDYHRVHLPLDGQLTESLYVPGRLFSVNPDTAQTISSLYSRNERLISMVMTEAGPMAVILVGAMIVGNIQTVYLDKPARTNKISYQIYKNIELKKGEELGYFSLGSTVILLFGKNKIKWEPAIKANQEIKLGQCLAQILSKN